MRVPNLQGLIYKSGQDPNVRRAYVAIVFNNEDSLSSPEAYKDYSEITVARQVKDGANKYFINGQVATVEKVENLFHSVRLNIKHPHFLIMQGMVTKVINVKPQEVLAMIEEAAGTGLYERSKQKALKVIQKKQVVADDAHRV